MSSWFASDLHLDPATPEIAARFRRFLAGPARDAHSIYLLGDLFEAWLGDIGSGRRECTSARMSDCWRASLSAREPKRTRLRTIWPGLLIFSRRGLYR